MCLATLLLQTAHQKYKRTNFSKEEDKKSKTVFLLLSSQEKKILTALNNCLKEASDAITKLSNRRANLNTCNLLISELMISLENYENDI